MTYGDMNTRQWLAAAPRCYGRHTLVGCASPWCHDTTALWRTALCRLCVLPAMPWCQDVMSTAVAHMYATSTRHRSTSHAQPSPRASDSYVCALADGGHHLRCTTSSRPPLDAARRDVVRTPALECMHAAATWHPIKSPSRLPPRPLGSPRRRLRDGGTRVYCVPLSPPPLDAAVLK